MSTLAQVRADLAERLQEHLPADWAVFPDASKAIDVIAKPTLSLQRTTIQRMAQASGFYTNTFEIWLIDPVTNNEDHLDDLLEELLEAIDEHTDIAWSTATRANYQDTNPAFTIAIEYHTRREQD